MKRILVILLSLLLLLTGCSALGNGSDYTPYDEMVYARPMPEVMAALLAECCETAREEKGFQEVLSAVFDYYDAYDRFYTNYNLAYIEYCRDVTNEYWAEEVAFCMEYANTVEAGLEELYMALAESPVRTKLEGVYFGEGFFEAYDGEAVWDEGFLALLNRESELIEEYYALCAETETEEFGSEEYYDRYADGLCQVLIDLVLLRQDLADYVGYDSYAGFAYDFYHYRDYTPEQAEAYMTAIRDAMAPLYRAAWDTDVWEVGWNQGEDMYSYVRTCAKKMGGLVWEAFTRMDRAKLYDIAHSPLKYGTSFEVYLSSYQCPYIFVSPTGYGVDNLTFAHEFGHFVTDYAVDGGSWAGTDVLEVFSQGMEYLSIAYGEANKDLSRYKLADCLSIYVEQSAYAYFEQLLYALPAEDLTVERLYELYDQTMLSFGIDYEAMGYDPRDLVNVSHFYTDPMYIISYVVSNDVAFQLYRMEQEKPGTGLACFERNLTTECYYLLDFAQQAGLENPMAPGRVEAVAAELASLLGLNAMT